MIYQFLYSLIVLLNITNIKTETFGQDYQSEHIEIEQISEHTYLHRSYLPTQSYGLVDCNGIIIVNKGKAIVVDTPIDNEASAELIEYVENELGASIKGVVTTHFHIDCLGGLQEFHKRNIPSYASRLTIELAKNENYTVPRNGFDRTLNLEIADLSVNLDYLGAGHTSDNIIVYVGDDKVLFGGCLVKSIGASKGNLEDANVEAWSTTVNNLASKYPSTKIVVPGHGKIGGKELFNYTSKLFANQ